MDGKPSPGVSLLSAHFCIMVRKKIKRHKFVDYKEQVMFHTSLKIQREKLLQNVTFDNEVLQRGLTAAAPIQTKGCVEELMVHMLVFSISGNNTSGP